MQRRAVLGLGALGLAGLAFGSWKLSHNDHLLLSARNDQQGRHFAVGYYLDGSQAFSTQVPERCHDAVPHPYLPLAVFVGRRPSRESYLIDTRNGHLMQTLRSPADRHFYGHGVFHHSGQWFYSTENDTREPGRGVLGVYQLDAQQLKRTTEHSTHGVGPHQLRWMPDGETLVIANGGIRTEADSREMLNLDHMEPSLVLMQRTGGLISKEQLSQSLNSIRHLAVAADGTIVSGQQYEGDARQAAPLLAIKRPGQPFRAFPIKEQQRAMMQQYTASLAIHDELRLLAVSAPRGNRFFIWNLDTTELLLDIPFVDCAGVGVTQHGFIVTSGQGRCRHFDGRHFPFKTTIAELPPGLWDNHLSLSRA